MNVYFLGMCISFIIYIIIGIIISRKVSDANDFYVAGRRAPVLLIVGSLIASYVSTGVFMGDAGEFYSGIFSPMVVVCAIQVPGYILGAAYFGRYLRRSGVLTVPEFFGKRFCSPALYKLATISALITMVVYLLSVMQGIGTLMNAVTGVDYNLCIVLALIAFVVVSVFSGARGVLITDTIMFGIFTIAMIVATFVITGKAGGWYQAVEDLVQNGKQGLLAASGNLDYMYATGPENILWGFIYGIVWLSACMVGPWQSSRFIMAKNEHTIIRAAIYSGIGLFVVEFLVGISAVTVNLFEPNLEQSTYALIYASMNILPTALGVLLLTGVLAAGVSSATTFLSLIGSSVANDIFQSKKRSISIGRITMVAVAVLILLLALKNPPAIRVILWFGGSILAASWMPVAVGSMVSKRITKTGAFLGMLAGFIGCFLAKMIPSLLGVTMPVFLEPTIVGMILNVLFLIIGSAATKVTEEERKIREDLLKVPESEKNPEELSKTKKFLKYSPLTGVLIFGILFFAWVLPYMMAIKK